MNITDTAIADVKIIHPRVFADARGFLLESFSLHWGCLNWPLCKTTTAARTKAYCAACIFSTTNRKASWCNVCAGRCLMWR